MNGSKPRSLKTTLFVFIFTTLVFLPNFVPLSNALITPPTGIILFIGDGMGYNHIELARLAEYGPEGESAILEMCYETSISTSNIDNEITDSAAAATVYLYWHPNSK